MLERSRRDVERPLDRSPKTCYQPRVRTLLAILVLLIPCGARADNTFGITLGAALPDGMSASLVVQPVEQLHVDLGATALLSPGLRAGVTLDPLDWVVGPTLTVAAGHNFWAAIPSATGRFEQTYVSVLPGLEIGERGVFRIYARAGYARLWINTRGVDKALSIKGLALIAGPKAIVNLWPSLSVGLTGYFK
jgi:hypothetical protein